MFLTVKFRRKYKHFTEGNIARSVFEAVSEKKASRSNTDVQSQNKFHRRAVLVLKYTTVDRELVKSLFP